MTSCDSPTNTGANSTSYVQPPGVSLADLLSIPTCQTSKRATSSAYHPCPCPNCTDCGPDAISWINGASIRQTIPWGSSSICFNRPSSNFHVPLISPSEKFRFQKLDTSLNKAVTTPSTLTATADNFGHLLEPRRAMPTNQLPFRSQSLGVLRNAPTSPLLHSWAAIRPHVTIDAPVCVVYSEPIPSPDSPHGGVDDWPAPFLPLVLVSKLHSIRRRIRALSMRKRGYEKGWQGPNRRFRLHGEDQSEGPQQQPHEYEREGESDSASDGQNSSVTLQLAQWEPISRSCDRGGCNCHPAQPTLPSLFACLSY